MESDIYTEVRDNRFIAHPPVSIWVVDSEHTLKSGFHEKINSPFVVEVYRHCSACTSAEARALGSDFDGYIRISITHNHQLIARAQSDYKGEPNPSMVQHIYEHLLTQLQWR